MIMRFAVGMLLAIAQRSEPAPPLQPVLVVTGNADVLAVPDEAVVRLGILRQAPVAQTAQDQANAVAQEILAAIAKVGVPGKDIHTERLVLSPVYNSRSADQRIASYNATNTVSIRLDNLALTGNVIDAGLKAGANQLNGVQFRLRNELPSREEALKKRCRKRAEKLKRWRMPFMSASLKSSKRRKAVYPSLRGSNRWSVHGLRPRSSKRRFHPVNLRFMPASRSAIEYPRSRNTRACRAVCIGQILCRKGETRPPLRVENN